MPDTSHSQDSKRRNSVISCLLLLFLLTLPTAASEAPKRIISLAPSVTETLFALGVGEQIIARTRYCTHPAEAAKIQSLGGMVSPNIEAIAKLKPDLVLASASTPETAIKKMVQVNLNAQTIDAKGVDTILNNIRETGSLVGRKGKAKEICNSITERINSINDKVKDVSDENKPRTIIFYGAKTHFCAGPGSFSGELLDHAGGNNVANEAGEPWPRLSRERIFAWNPQVILLSLSHHPEEIKGAETLVEGWKKDPLWSRMDAVKNNRIHLVTQSLLTVPGPRVADATESLAAVLYPELFPEIKPEHVRPAIQP